MKELDQAVILVLKLRKTLESLTEAKQYLFTEEKHNKLLFATYTVQLKLKNMISYVEFEIEKLEEEYFEKSTRNNR